MKFPLYDAKANSGYRGSDYAGSTVVGLQIAMT